MLFADVVVVFVLLAAMREWLDVKSKTLNLSSSLSLAVFCGRGRQHLNELLAIDAVLIVDDHFSESFIDFLAGEFLSPGHEGVSQILAVDEAGTIIKRLEGGNDDFIVIGTYLSILHIFIKFAMNLV